MKRKTVLINDTIANSIMNFRPKSLQPEIWKILMESLFAGTLPSSEDLPDDLHNLFVCIEIELHKIQSKFENGKSKKNFTMRKTGLLGPVDGSESKRIEANRSEKNPSDYYNNIYNNKYNNQYQSIKSIDFSSEKTEGLYYEILETLQSIESIDPKILKQIEKAIKEVATTSESININKKPLEPVEVLEKILSKFENLAPAVIENEVKRIFTEIDSKKVNNRKRYIIASLFNISQSQKAVQSTKVAKNYSQRSYTEKDYASVLDDLDDSELINL